MNTEKIKKLEAQIIEAKTQIVNLTQSAMDGLRSREYHFASKKVLEIIEHETTLEELNELYENELSNWGDE